jgi:hypothetical protein
MKTKKVVINFVGVSSAVAVRIKGQAGMPATPTVPGVPALTRKYFRQNAQNPLNEKFWEFC